MDPSYYDTLPSSVAGGGFYGSGHTYLDENALIVVQPIFSDGTWVAPPQNKRSPNYHEPVVANAALPGTPYTWQPERGYVDSMGNPIPAGYGGGAPGPDSPPTTVDAMNALATAAVAFAKTVGN